ncbi:MAG: maleate cis-trans isomerase family protein [Candidatus Binatia bacterium]
MKNQPRIGLIIPSSNRLTEPQFNRYAPPSVAIHITRLRMTGKWRKPLAELKGSLTEAAEALSDVKPGVIVFHCTANSMENGLAHEAAIVETVQSAGGCQTLTTAQAITEAFEHVGIKKLVLISPYVKETNEHEVHYLKEAGFEVLHERGLGLESHAYSAVSPEEWIKVVNENTRPEADGYFLSCTNTRMIEAIESLEEQLGKPVINSNQATLWACLRKLGVRHADNKLGRLFNSN